MLVNLITIFTRAQAGKEWVCSSIHDGPKIYFSPKFQTQPTAHPASSFIGYLEPFSWAKVTMI
jgi:hypothetical protein